MEKIREAIITEDNKVLCPYCNKINHELTGLETVRNFKVRCRGSNGRISHYFTLNIEPKKEEKENG